LGDRLCPACQGKSGFQRCFTTFDGHQFVQCIGCGCWFTPKRVDNGVFEELFAREPEARAVSERIAASVDAAACRETELARFGLYLDDLLGVLPVTRHRRAFLHVSCGAGHALRAGRARGINVRGVEADSAAVAAAQFDGLPVTSAAGEPPAGSYDLVAFWDSLAHDVDPVGTLRRYTPSLHADGLVTITVANRDALEARLGREACDWIYGGYIAPGTLQLFHEQSLRALAANAGLSVVDAWGESAASLDRVMTLLTAGSPREDAAVVRDATPGAVSLSSVASVVALVEAVTLASPRIHVIACRAGREHVFAAACEARRAARRESWAAIMTAMCKEQRNTALETGRLRDELDRRGTEHAAAIREIGRLRTVLDDRASWGLIGRLRQCRQLAGRAARRLGLRR
jgi:hypothetical protein